MLSRKYNVLMLLVMMGSLIGVIIHLETQRYFKPQEYGEYKPLVVTVLPGHYAEEYGYKRRYDINNFSVISEYIPHYEVIRKASQTAIAQAKEYFDLTGHYNYSSSIKSSDSSTPSCQPKLCNENVCFENLLCPQLPKFAKDFKNPCFYEEVCWLSKQAINVLPFSGQFEQYFW